MMRKNLWNLHPNQRAGIRCQAQLDIRGRIHSEKTRIVKDEARARNLSKKGSRKQSTIRCSKQPGTPLRGTATKHRKENRKRKTGFAVRPSLPPRRGKRT